MILTRLSGHTAHPLNVEPDGFLSSTVDQEGEAG